MGERAMSFSFERMRSWSSRTAVSILQIMVEEGGEVEIAGKRVDHQIDPDGRLSFEEQTALEDSIPEAYRSTVQNPNIDRESELELVMECRGECVLIAERLTVSLLRLQMERKVKVPEWTLFKERPIGIGKEDLRMPGELLGDASQHADSLPWSKLKSPHPCTP